MLIQPFLGMEREFFSIKRTMETSFEFHLLKKLTRSLQNRLNLLKNHPHPHNASISENVVFVCVIKKESSGADWLVVWRLRWFSTKYLSEQPALQDRGEEKLQCIIDIAATPNNIALMILYN